MTVQSSKLMAAAVLIFLGACRDNHPTNPSPVPTPTPTSPVTVRYSVSGIVTDDVGAPVVGATVEIDFMPPPGSLARFVVTTTDNTGRYALTFDTTGPLRNVPTAAGEIIAFVRDYDHNLQFVPWGTTTIVKNMVIRRARMITAGESAMVSVDANSSICSDLEDWFIPTRQCAQIHVVAPANGTLVIDARPLQDAGAVPIVFSATSGFYRRQILGPGTVTLLEVQAGKSYHIFVGTPEGVVSQQYAVSTSLQAPAAGGQ